MTILPIVQRELREKARRPQTLRARVSVALAAVLLYTLILISTQSVLTPGAGGRGLFTVLVGFGFLACLIAGVRLTCDCLSSEKREGTLGFLFLTDLRGYDIVLGKLASNGLVAFYALISVSPVLALCLLSGGVRGYEVAQATIGLLNTLFFGMAVGLLTSAFSENNRRSESTASLIIILFLFGAPFLSHFADANLKQLQAGSILQLFSPSFFNFGQLPLTGGTLFRGNFWTTTLVTHLLAWLFIGAASLRLPTSWQDKPARARDSGGKPQWQAWIYGDRETRARLRKHLLAVSPFCWLASRERFKKASVWLVMGLTAVASFAIFWSPKTPFHFDLGSLIGALILTGAVWSAILHVWISANAGKMVFEARSNGSLELLLSTPLTVGEIVRGQWLALRRQFGKPFLSALSVGGAIIAITVFSHNLPNWSDERRTVVFTVLTIATIFSMNAIALGWVGIWLGVRLRDKRQLMASTIGYVWIPQVIPFGPYGYLSSTPLFQSLGLTELIGFLFFWLIIGGGIALTLIVWTRRQVREHFRVVAGQIEPTTGSWGRWLGIQYVRLRRRMLGQPVSAQYQE